MIYVCIPSHNNGGTIGLLLWKIRKVFDDFPRDYHLLVSDDCSSDATRETLKPYEKTLPLMVVTQQERRGYARNLECLLLEALKRRDRPKRDLAIPITADFSVSPTGMPEMIRRFESGADVIVGESRDLRLSLVGRLTRRSARWLLRPGVRVPGVRDFISGCSAFRLMTLKRCFRDSNGSLLMTEGLAAHAELVARASAAARQIATVPVEAGPMIGPAETDNLALAVQLFKAGRLLAIPPPAEDMGRAS